MLLDCNQTSCLRRRRRQTKPCNSMSGKVWNLFRKHWKTKVNIPRRLIPIFSTTMASRFASRLRSASSSSGQLRHRLRTSEKSCLRGRTAEECRYLVQWWWSGAKSAIHQTSKLILLVFDIQQNSHSLSLQSTSSFSIILIKMIDLLFFESRYFMLIFRR